MTSGCLRTVTIGLISIVVTSPAQATTARATSQTPQTAPGIRVNVCVPPHLVQ